VCTGGTTAGKAFALISKLTCSCTLGVVGDDIVSPTKVVVEDVEENWLCGIVRWDIDRGGVH
jgi:hypothetical protein